MSKESDRLRSKVNAKYKYDLYRKVGFCTKCGKGVEINPKTNKSYSECKYHRTLTNIRSANRYIRNRNESNLETSR